ncbi:hypothetical protein [Streptomyces toxytricini]|uniref:hypothetical protein n=1 Tax=Streptomyces toxytricini TaxID=67369 RepID=UPI00343C6E9D
MTWYRQSPPTAQAARAARIRRGAVIAFVLFLPLLAAAELAVLATDAGGRCLVYGGCEPFPWRPFLWVCGAAAAAFAAALAAPLRFRAAARGAQVGLQVLAALIVLARP